MGIHHRSCGSVYWGPSARNASTRPRLEGLKMCRPRHRIRYFDAMETATTPMKIHIPRVLHHWPCNVPGTRRMKAALLPVSRPLAGHMITLSLKKPYPNSISAPVRSEEHTSELQSQSNLVCRLLLEKKKPLH